MGFHNQRIMHLRTDKCLLFFLSFIVGTTITGVAHAHMQNESSGVPAFYDNERDLMVEVMKDYRKEFRPVRDSRRALNVQLYPQLAKIIKLDEKEGFLKVGMYTYMNWEDEYLTWDESRTHQLYSVSMPLENLHVPHIILLEQRVVTAPLDQLLKQYPARVNFVGLVDTSPIVELEINCEAGLKSFPFDTQFCIFTFFTGASSDTISLRQGNPDNYIPDRIALMPNSEWLDVETNVTELPIQITLQYYTVNMQYVLFGVRMSRNPAFYVVYLLIPSMLMAFVSVLVFLLPPESGERIGLCITVLLSYTVFLLMVSEFTPRGGNDTAYLAMYITAIEILSGLNLLFTVIVLRIHNHEADDPMPAYLKRFSCEKKGSETPKNAWHRVAQTCDNFLFVFMLLVVVLLTCLLIGYYIFASRSAASLVDYMEMRKEYIRLYVEEGITCF